MKVDQISQAGEPGGAPVPSQTSPLQRILVVDDDTDLLKLNTEVLIHSGYEVDAAEDGAVAWQKLNTDRYDLLITDHNMPKLTGVELLKKLRAAHMALPAILATAALPEEEFIRSPWLQPAATLRKPYTVEEMLGTVKEVLRATDGACEQTAPPPNWQSPRSADRLQL